MVMADVACCFGQSKFSRDYAKLQEQVHTHTRARAQPIKSPNPLPHVLVLSD
eukprot:COSAG05_NODE_3618_length_1956_cov_2.703823_2_plen_52_part_00